MIGSLLDQRYQVVELLGKGGFGHTYIAQDTRRPGNPTCVVKHLKPANNDPDFCQLRDACLVGKLKPWKG